MLQNLTQTSDLDDDPAAFELDLAPFGAVRPLHVRGHPVRPAGEDGLARQAEAQYWGGAALSLSTPTSVFRPPVADLPAGEGTVDWWFRLESGWAERSARFRPQAGGRAAGPRLGGDRRGRQPRPAAPTRRSSPPWASSSPSATGCTTLQWKQS
ncbi:MAG: hypothetical protein M5U09_30445 [Gammaproteobacteria bacterium]|nr:hypothetical protein [Gammaproteobacteria bacterium]